jgi:hypothetical protein
MFFTKFIDFKCFSKNCSTKWHATNQTKEGCVYKIVYVKEMKLQDFLQSPTRFDAKLLEQILELSE